VGSGKRPLLGERKVNSATYFATYGGHHPDGQKQKMLFHPHTVHHERQNCRRAISHPSSSPPEAYRGKKTADLLLANLGSSPIYSARDASISTHLSSYTSGAISLSQSDLDKRDIR